jgi:hypothetical protein
VNLEFISKYPTIKIWLIAQVGYYSKQIHQFKNGLLTAQKKHDPRVIIVAKCHYSELWQSFASVNKKELDKILKLKRDNHAVIGVTFQIFKNDAIDGFDVKITTIDQAVITSLGQSKIYIPETELFLPNESNALTQIETLAGKMFCASISNKMKSSYAKGIVDNVDTYKLSVGLPDEINPVIIQADSFSAFLLSQLFKLNLSSLTRATSFNIKAWFNLTQLHLLYWAPILTALCFYLVLNASLYLKTNSLEESLAAGGQQVSDIIIRKRQLDNNLAELSVLSTELNQRGFVHHYWQIVDALLTANMKITRITYKEGKLVIRGLADKASDVLATISSNEQISSAAFEGAVRKSGSQDSFILTMQIKEL